jgi:hypothetical protein
MITTSVVSSSEPNNDKKMMWFWQSSPSPRDDDQRKGWKRYSDFENEYIEEAYQRKNIEVQLNGYIINFEYSMQLNIDDRNIKKPVKREEINLSQYVREDRFCHPQRASKSFESEAKEENSFFFKWLTKNQQIKRNFPVIADLAAQGTSICVCRHLIDVTLYVVFSS